MMNRQRVLVVLLGVAAVATALPTVAFAQAMCTSSAGQPVSMSAVVALGGHLTSDGRGAYADESQGSYVTLTNGANLVTNFGAQVNKNSRFLAFNLNSPNPISDPVTATPLGVINDPRGEVHVLYYLTQATSGGLHTIHLLQEAPDGVPVTSERTDLFVHINGVRHLLMFGGDTWPINICRPDLGMMFGASGTTKLQITRMGDTYTLQTANAIGRLFDYSDQFAPVDRGLYRFNFHVTMSPKTKGKK